MPTIPAVEVSGLVMRYGDKVAVDGLDLAVAEHTITAVLGPNGAGKTTTLETCEGYRRPQQGTVRVLGLDPAADQRALLPRIGVMLQGSGAWSGVRAMEMLRHIARLHAHPLDVDMLADRLGLHDCGRTPYRRLSGGQQQRLGLALAVVGRPEVVFVDEPTAGMDPLARRTTWELLEELRADGVTVVLTTHYMDEAERLADQIHIIDQGRMIASGTPADLTRGGTATIRLVVTKPFPPGAPASLQEALGPQVSVTPISDVSLLIAGPADSTTLATVDSFGVVLGWDDHTAPRATTIFFKALQALVEVNRLAVLAGQPAAQATVFQVRTLLTDPAFREAVLAKLPAVAKAWWTTTFTAYGDDAFAPALNPLDRLAADPVARSLLGAPTGKWNARAAMDRRRIVWLCLGGTGPTQRLLVNLLMRDVFRAGLSRGDLPTRKRKPFHIWMDELISLDQAGTGSTIADITEQLRKFGIRLHVLAQLLERINRATRASLLQNASALSTTAGSTDSVGAITEQWHGAITARQVAELPRYHHALSFTAGGKQRGPVTVRGPQPHEVFGSLKSTKHLGDLTQSSGQAVGARTAASLHRIADQQDQKVADFLRRPAVSTGSRRQASPRNTARTARVELVKPTTTTEFE